MFDIGWTELLVVATVAIIVVGPKDLPRMLRTFGQTIGKVRRMATDFQSTFNDAIKEAERQVDLDDVKNSLNEVKDLNPLDDIKKQIEDPLIDVKSAIESTVDDSGVLDKTAPSPSTKDDLPEAPPMTQPDKPVETAIAADNADDGGEEAEAQVRK